MIIDGKAIAQDIKHSLLKRIQKIEDGVSLGIIVVKEDPLIRQFVRYKELYAQEIGVRVEVIRMSNLEQREDLLLQHILHGGREYHGLILQLPIPSEFSLENVLNLYPMSVDVDVLGNTAYRQFLERNLPFLPPVVGAFEEVIDRNKVRLGGANVVVAGEGRLVGAPAATWMRRAGAKVVVANKDTQDLGALTQKADIIVLGTGNPGLLTPDMIKEGVVILDAGTGEMAGAVQGDADPACAEKASVFTPTPGGIGPITVAKVFENLLTLYELTHRDAD